MVTLDESYVSVTLKVRLTGNSLVVGLTKDICKLIGIEPGTMLQLFVKKVGEVKKPDADPGVDGIHKEVKQEERVPKDVRIDMTNVK